LSRSKAERRDDQRLRRSTSSKTIAFLDASIDPRVRGYGDTHDPADSLLEHPRHVYAVEVTQVFAFGKETGFRTPSPISPNEGKTR
jgi:hypothetical protein